MVGYSIRGDVREEDIREDLLSGITIDRLRVYLNSVPVKKLIV